MRHLFAGLTRALRYGGDTHTVEDVLDAVEQERARMWVRDNALIVTETLDYPQCRVLRFWLATGEMDAVLALSREIEGWARDEGCDRAVLVGRKGWTKALADQGWAPAKNVVHLEKRL